MGFFSAGCTCCRKSLLSPQAVRRLDPFAWMAEGAVVVTKDGSILKGVYDGHGRIENSAGGIIDISNLMMGGDANAYHSLCWVAAGAPYEWDGKPMLGSPDQGWFFADKDYEAVPKPVVPENKGNTDK
jgi:hypothetical protein